MPRLTHSKEVNISVSLISIKLMLPGCFSLKQKRSTLQPILSRIRKEFNVSVAETGLNEIWHSSWIGAVTISSDADFNSGTLSRIVDLIEHRFPEVQVEEFHIETR